MKNSNRLMLLGGVAGLMLTAISPLSADMGIWPSADANKDGSIDRSEFDTARAARFTGIDGDSDGFVTQEEMKTFHEARRAEMKSKHGDMAVEFMKRADADSDGKITSAEWPKEGRKTFAEVDSNGDGAVTVDELGRMHKPHDGKDRFARLDSDKDGKLSMPEWAAMGDKMFARLDDNADGRIEKDELPKHRKGDRSKGEEAPLLP